jgi:hypothetical protein
MDDGAAPVANTVYYVFLIRKDSDGSIDALFSLSATAPTMPAGYTYKRMIRRQVTDAAANIIPTTQSGDYVLFKKFISDRATSAIASTNRTAYVVSGPPNMISLLELNVITSAGAGYFWMGDENYIDTAASSSYRNVIGTTTHEFIGKQILLNATSQIYGRGDTTNLQVGINTLGWIDDRGRDA